MNYINEWIRDLINCRKNRITLEEANEKIIKLSSEITEYKILLESFKQEAEEQYEHIKEVSKAYNEEKSKNEQLTKETFNNLNKVIQKNPEVYNNIAIDSEGLDLINNFIKGNK